MTFYHVETPLELEGKIINLETKSYNGMSDKKVAPNELPFWNFLCHLVGLGCLT